MCDGMEDHRYIFVNLQFFFFYYRQHMWTGHTLRTNNSL